jgi:putative protease
MSTELLSPAGSLRAMRFAFAYGADAVYAGQPRYSLRVRNNEFSKLEALAEGIAEAHRLGKKFYLASNVSPHNDKVRTYLRDLTPVIDMNPDALIMSDPGLIMMVRENFPDMPIHLSVQANAVNYATVKFWHRQGIERVILSRELSIDEIAEIKQRVPEMELEVFVHGALCIAYSGRCLLSGYMNHRDPNQGACTNACRWSYKPTLAKETLEGDVIPVAQAVEEGDAEQPEIWKPTDEVFLLEEAQRPGEQMPVFEDEHGTYIMNSKDLRAVQHIEKLVEIGVESVKIEGRTKSHFYAARTAQVYRKAIDDALAGRPFDMSLLDTLDGLANRGYTEGFLRRHVPKDLQNYMQGSSQSNRQKFVGEVLGVENGFALVDVKNRFEVGDELELMTPEGNATFRLGEMYRENGEPVDAAPGSGHKVKIPIPMKTLPDYCLLIRNLA